MNFISTLTFHLILMVNLSFAIENQPSKALWDKPLQELLDLKVTTATRQESRGFLLPSIINVISGEDLKRWGASNLADGLRQASAISVRKTPGDFPQYSTIIRGNSSDFMNMRTLFLIDGVVVRNPNAGFDPSWIPVGIIEKVEIVKGPVSSLYGANAFGGVINIITKKGRSQNNKGIDELEVGGHLRNDHTSSTEILGHNFSLQTGNDKSSWSYFALAESHLAEDSKTSYSGHTYQDIYGKLSIAVADNVDLAVAALFSLDRNQIATSNSDSPIKNNFTHLATTADIKVNEYSDLKVTGHFNDFDHFLKYTDNLEKYDNQGSSIGFNFVYSAELNPQNKIVSGLEYIRENGSLSTNEMNYSTFTVSNVGWDKQTIETYSVYIQDQYTGWQNMLTLLGVRYDQNSLYGGAVSPRIGFSYLISENFSTYVAIGQAFRSPVFNETHINGFGKVGNKNLKPELTLTHEVGFKSITDKSENEASIFFQKISEKIDLRLVDSSDPNSLSTYDNLGSAELFGGEWSGSYKLFSNFKAIYSAMLVSAKEGTDDLDRSKLTLGFNTTMASWDLAVSLTHKGKVFKYDSTGNKQYIDAVTTADIQANKKIFGNIQLEFYIQNIFDEIYKESYSEFLEQSGLFLPGRTIGLKARSHF